MLMTGEWRQASRRVFASPVLTLVVVLCLSIGVWMACIVSAIVGGAFRPRLGFHSPERIVFIQEAGLFSMVKEDRLRSARVTSAAVIDSLTDRQVFAAIGFYER